MTGEEGWALAFVQAYKAHPSDDCILWSYTLTPNGYGLAGRMYAHRLLYIAVKGAVPEGLELDHLCATKKCVNAGHLEAVEHAVNTRRHYAKQTHCKHGHEFTPENTGLQSGRRFCRTCAARRARETYRRARS